MIEFFLVSDFIINIFTWFLLLGIARDYEILAERWRQK
jgi:hypothetical protein